jgi:hypothetical protein
MCVPSHPITLSAEFCSQTVKITTNYTCALQYGIKPNWTEYTLGVFQNNNGYEATYWLGRVDNPPKISTVTLKVYSLFSHVKSMLRLDTDPCRLLLGERVVRHSRRYRVPDQGYRRFAGVHERRAVPAGEARSDQLVASCGL